MKTKKIVLPLIAAIALALGLASCSKNEPVTPAADNANKAAEAAKTEAAKAADVAKAEAAKAADAAKAEATKTADAAKAEAARVADAAKAEAAKTADAAKVEAAKAEAAKAEAAKVAEAAKADAAKAADSAKAQGLIDKARNLIAESKFSDASSVLQQLTGLSLTSEQTKLVDALKEQIQKALAAKAAENAVGAAGNLLKQ